MICVLIVVQGHSSLREQGLLLGPVQTALRSCQHAGTGQPGNTWASQRGLEDPLALTFCLPVAHIRQELMPGQSDVVPGPAWAHRQLRGSSHHQSTPDRQGVSPAHHHKPVQTPGKAPPPLVSWKEQEDLSRVLLQSLKPLWLCRAREAAGSKPSFFKPRETLRCCHSEGCVNSQKDRLATAELTASA